MSKKILIFGGSGFIGSALIKPLLEEGNSISVICRDDHKARKKLPKHHNLHITSLDIFDKQAVQKVVLEHEVVINLIGKLFEKQKGDFAKFHYQFPKLLTEVLSNKQQLIHISALGIEESSASSLYAKTKLDGENVIMNHASNYHIIKPSIVFGEDDNFFNLFAKMAKISPFLPLIGGGKSKFSPIYVQDLVQAIIVLIKDNQQYHNQIFEAFGPKTATFKALMQFILKTIKKKRLLITLPFFFATLQAKCLNLLKIYVLTPDQVALLKYDNIAQNRHDNIDTIIGDLQSYEKIVPQYLK